jgi:hypothetical protein
MSKPSTLHALLRLLFKPHPWHGIPPGDSDSVPDLLNAYIEIVPTDTVKYEIDIEDYNAEFVDSESRMETLV